MTFQQMYALLYELNHDPNNRFHLDFFNEKDRNPFQLKTVLEGAIDSIYEGGYYVIKIIIPEDYPNKRPGIFFLNKIFHPHVNQSDGRLDTYPLLKNNDILSVLECADNILFNYDFQIDHAYHQEPLICLKKDKNEFIRKAKEWVKNYAKIEDLNKFYDSPSN